MGYRELLKKYIRFVESQVGNNFIGAVGYVMDGPFTDRELGELRALAVDIDRTINGASACARVPSCNYRLRLLCICFGLTLEQAAQLGGVDATLVRRWRADPLSRHYAAMTETDFARFEHALIDWLAHRQREAACPAPAYEGGRDLRGFFDG